MSDPIKLSIVLPAYLEEENLRLLVPRIKQSLEQFAFAWEVVVVDTVSPLDGTQQLCAEQSVHYVRRRPGNTFGDAVRTGIAEADGEWILFMDADGSHSPEFIPELVTRTDHYDIVIASRYTEGGYSENSLLLRLMSRLLNLSYAIVLNLKCKDVSNSFKIYRAELLKELELECDNFDIVEEILFKICRRHPQTTILELPFTFKKRMFGETKRNLVVFMITYLYTICRLRWGGRHIAPPRTGRR